MSNNKSHSVYLKDILFRQKGINITAQQMKELDSANGNIKVFAGGNTTANIQIDDIPEKYIITKPSIIVKSRGNIDFDYYEGPFTHKNELWSYSTNSNDVNLKYIYYILKVNKYSFVNKAKANSVKLPQLTVGDTDNFEIPLPHIKVQEEIVKILDSFTNLIDALNEEMSLRQKQFEYYREKLLTFDETVERLSFGNDFSLKARIGWQGLTKKEYRKSGDYYLITGTDFKDGNKIDFSTCVYVDEERYTQDPNIQIKPNDVLITKDGTLGKVAFIEKIDKPATLNGGVFVVRSKVGGVIPKYVAYYLSSPIFKNWIEQNHTNGSIMHLTQKLLVKFEIAIPSTEVQQSIVEKLDAFESLISSLKEEIALRQKQYEYYREKLLTFD